MAHLSRRMQAAASLVTSGNRLADVGTDHGYVPISLVQTGRVPFAYAMDINKGPLEKASANIRREGLEDKITTILGDGLAGLHPGDADTILIAGMGGELVLHILTEGSAIREAAKELVLQPQSDIRKVREFLREKGWQITEEEMILEEGKYYPMMRCVKSNKLGTGVQLDENSNELGTGVQLGENSDRSLNKAENKTEMTDISHKQPESIPENENMDTDVPGGNPSVSEPEISTDVCDIYGPILLRKKHPVLLSYLQKENTTLQNILRGFEGKKETENIIRSRQEIAQKLAYNQAALRLMAGE